MIELHPEDHIYREATTRHLEWVVTSMYLRPDGVLKRVYCINGEDLLTCHIGTVLLIHNMTGLFPGPTIEARSGDTLVITLINRLEDESISIHWHGLRVQSKCLSQSGILLYPITNYIFQAQWTVRLESRNAQSLQGPNSSITSPFLRTRAVRFGTMLIPVWPEQMGFMEAL
jgi:hypothetical protein